MARDIEDTIDQSMNHEERAVCALECIAEALAQWVKICQQRFDKEYPPRTGQDATVTKLKSEEDRRREDLGDTGESLEEWVGLREREVINKKKQ